MNSRELSAVSLRAKTNNGGISRFETIIEFIHYAPNQPAHWQMKCEMHPSRQAERLRASRWKFSPSSSHPCPPACRHVFHSSMDSGQARLQRVELVLSSAGRQARAKTYRQFLFNHTSGRVQGSCGGFAAELWKNAVQNSAHLQTLDLHPSLRIF